MYQVNYLNSVDDDDLVYDDIQTAYTEAIELTEVDPEAAFGVWQDEELLAIVFEGEVFTR